MSRELLVMRSSDREMLDRLVASFRPIPLCDENGRDSGAVMNIRREDDTLVATMTERSVRFAIPEELRFYARRLQPARLSGFEVIYKADDPALVDLGTPVFGPREKP